MSFWKTARENREFTKENLALAEKELHEDIRRVLPLLFEMAEIVHFLGSKEIEVFNAIRREKNTNGNPKDHTKIFAYANVPPEAFIAEFSWYENRSFSNMQRFSYLRLSSERTLPRHYLNRKNVPLWAKVTAMQVDEPLSKLRHMNNRLSLIRDSLYVLSNYKEKYFNIASPDKARAPKLCPEEIKALYREYRKKADKEDPVIN